MLIPIILMSLGLLSMFSSLWILYKRDWMRGRYQAWMKVMDVISLSGIVGIVWLLIFMIF